MSDKTFRLWEPDQQMLFPPSIKDFVPEGHLALDGTKVKANASKHSAMSYARMKKREPELAKLVEEWMREAGRADEDEDDEHGPGRSGL